MKTEIIALALQEGGKIFSQLLLNYRQNRIRNPDEDLQRLDSEGLPLESSEELEALFSKEEDITPISHDTSADALKKEATGIEAGCIPCALGHVGTCSGLLEEAVRFARSDGMTNDITIDRMNKCLDELNTMERGDLTTEKIVVLDPWEKEIAEETLSTSRQTRHAIEGCRTLAQLEDITAKTTTIRSNIGRKWFGRKIKMAENKSGKNNG
jgi:hypothetical protein